MINNVQFIANHYGYPTQSIKLIEEMAELTQAVCKVSATLNPTTKKGEQALIYFKNQVLEEIADVEIMLEQVKHLLGLTEKDIALVKDAKVTRQLDRIKHQSRGDNNENINN